MKLNLHLWKEQQKNIIFNMKIKRINEINGHPELVQFISDMIDDAYSNGANGENLDSCTNLAYHLDSSIYSDKTIELFKELAKSMLEDVKENDQIED